MTIINTGENQIKWTVRKGLSSVNEDFTRSDVMLFAISQTNKIPLPITSKEKGVIVATIPLVFSATQEHPEYAHRGIQEDTYDVELVWIKNKRELNRTYLHNAFRVSDNQLIPTLTVEIVSTAQSYGYDGLSAYEIAMFRRLSEGESAICENQWLEDLLAEKANTTDLNAEIINRENADSTLSSRIDSEVTDRQEEDIILNKKIQAETTVRSMYDNLFLALINDINYKIPEGASDTNKLTDKQYVDNQMAQKANISYVDDNFATKQALNQEAFERGQKDDLLYNKIDGVSTRVGTVERLIPTEADPNNMLADKEFVNSSISTNTATFRGTYNLVTDLGLSAGATNAEIAQALLVATYSCDNNDYCFTAVPVSNDTPTTIKEVRRFKYNETNNSWVYEYTLNNSGFTAAQWAAILSGITSTLVNKLTTLPTNNLLTSKFNEKQDVLVSGSNIKSINGKSVLGSGNLEIKDILLVLYNSTSYNDIAQAYIGGKMVLSFDLPNGRLYTLTSITNDGATFTSFDCDAHSFHSFVVNSSNVYSAVVTTPIQEELAFDNTPTLNSNNPVTSNGVKSADNEVLLRMLGTSEHYNGYNDPILRKEFVGNSELDPKIRRKETLHRANNYLDQLYYAIINGLCYRGFDDGQPKPLSDEDRLAISHGLIHMDILGGCIWIINAPYNFSTGSFRQIALGAQNYSYSTQESDIIDVTVTNGIDIGNKILQRLSTYNTSTGEVTWTNWSELIDVSDKQDVISDLSTIRSGAAAGATAYQKPSSGIPASDLASGVIPDISNLANKAGSLFQDFAAKSLAIRGRGTGNGLKLYREDGQFPYGRLLMESDLTGMVGIDYVLPTFDGTTGRTLVLVTTASRTTVLSNASTDDQYPSAKCVYDAIGNVKPFVVNVGINPDGVISVNKTLAELDTAHNAGKTIRVQFTSSSGISFEEDATRINKSLVITYVTHAVSDGKHYIVTIYEEDNVTKASYQEILDSDKQDKLTFDNTPTSGSTNPVTSAGIKTALDNKQDTLVSGTNIKTINNQSVLGSGNVNVHPEIVNLTDGEHNSAYYEDLMRTVDVLKLNTSQIFLYKSYNNNNIATTAMCFSACTNTETPTTNAVIKQTLFLGTNKFIRTLSNTVDDNKYRVVNGWAPILDIKQSDLDSKVSRSGSSMTGDLNMDYHGLQVSANRNGIKFESDATGVLVGNGDMNTTIQSVDTDLKHRKGSTDYTILDTSNVKTINGNSINGSGDLLLYTVSDVKANLEAMFTALVSAGVIQNYTLTDPASGSKTFGFSFT